MPFKSKAQQKACYATHGFHGKVDCAEWSSVTDQKSLPKKKKKYQFAGSTPCGEGTQWDDATMQCVPIPRNPNQLDPVFQQNYSGNPTDFQQNASTQANGKVIPNQIVPITNQNGHAEFDPTAGAYTKRGDFVPQQNVIGDAIDKGFNYDSDNTYRKNVYTTDNNILGYNDTFKGINLGLDLLQGFGNVLTDEKTKRRERLNLQKARYSHSHYNPYEQGLNQGGVYQEGGKVDPKFNDPRYELASAPGYHGVQWKFKPEYATHTVKGNPTATTAIPAVAGIDPNSNLQYSPDPTNYSFNYPDEANNMQSIYFKNQQLYNDALKYASSDQPGYRGTNNFAGSTQQGNKYSSLFKQAPLQAGGMVASQQCPNGKCYEKTPINLNLSHLFRNKSRQEKQAEIEYYANPQNWLGDRAGFMLRNADFNKYPVTSFDPQPHQDGISYQPNDTVQNGGLINKTGYTPGTPTFNNPLNVIPGGDITMQNTPFPVMAHPDNGNPVLMQPGQDYNFENAKYVTEVPMKKGGSIHIKESHKGKFTAYKKRTGKTTEEALHSDDPHVRQMANFAKNAKKWKHATGGDVEETNSNGQGNAELEQGEVFMTQPNQQDPQGAVQKVAENEPTHEDGGSVQQNVDRVLEDTSDKRRDTDSKSLRISPAEAKTIVGFKPKGTVSHSKLYEQAAKKYDTKLKTFQNKVDANLDYIKQNGGQYAQASLDQNLKLMENMLTKGDIFDAIYAHQENIKQMNSINNAGKFQTGGSKDDAIKLTDPTGWEFLGQEGKKKYYRKKGSSEVKTVVGGVQVDMHGKSNFGVDDILNKPDQFATFNQNMEGAPDDVKRKAAEDLFYKGIMPYKYTVNKNNPDQYGYMQLPDDPIPGVNNRPPVGTQYNTPNGNKPSTFNEPLKAYDVAGNIDNYLSSSERIPVSFEQLSRQPIQAHLINPQPALNANQGDFNAAIQTLPNNGVGYANQANLLANKYKINNEVVGQTANQNSQIQSRTDEVNNNNQYQLDQTNFQLRDRAVTQQLQGMEVERQSKLNAFDDYLTKLAQNAQLNRNGNLVLQMTPFFDQYGKFNGNKYVFQDKGDGTGVVIDKKTGKLLKKIVTDPNGEIKQSTQYIRG